MLTPDSILLIFVAFLFGWLWYLNLPLSQTKYIRKKLNEIWNHWQCQNHNTDNAYEPSAEYRAEEKRFWDRQIREAKRLNVITLFAGGVAFLALLGLIKSLYDAEYSTVLANRAWLMIKPPSVRYSKSGSVESISPTIYLENVGKGPAFDVRVYIRPVWTKSPTPHYEPNGLKVVNGREVSFEENITCDYVRDQLSIGVIWPNDTPIGANDAFQDEKIGFSNAIDLYGVQACVSYSTFGETRHTRACFFYTPDNLLDRRTWKWSACQGKDQQWAN
jgi:hypothetical protein